MASYYLQGELLGNVIDAVVRDATGGRRGLDALFANVVHGTTPIDVSPVAARLGCRLVLDSIPVVDSAGRPLADVRLSIDFGDESGALSLVLPNPATPWARAGLRTGDQLVSLNGVTVHSTREMQQALSSLHPGDEVPVEVRRNGQATRITVAVTGYSRPRVRFVDVANVTAGQRARRLDWAAGR